MSREKTSHLTCRSFAREEGAKKQATRYAAVAKARDQLDLRALDIDTATQGQTDSLPLKKLGVDFGTIFR